MVEAGEPGWNCSTFLEAPIQYLAASTLTKNIVSCRKSNNGKLQMVLIELPCSETNDKDEHNPEGGVLVVLLEDLMVKKSVSDKWVCNPGKRSCL